MSYVPVCDRNFNDHRETNMTSSSVSLKGKIAVITGANAGIGKVTAREIARAGATTVIVCRNQAKGKAAREEIIGASGNQDVHLMIADMADQASIETFASEFHKHFSALHVLVNNAGLMLSKRELTPKGVEMTLAINHLGYFITTLRLLDLLKQSAPSRIVCVASRAHYRGRLDFDNLSLERGFSAMRAYTQSKLANVLFASGLARRLEGSGVAVNSLHPGVVATEFTGEAGWIWRLGWKLGRPFMITPEEGARTSIYLATSPEVEGKTGLYWDKCKPKTPSRAARDPELAKRLWDWSVQQTGLDI
ncbi:MAG: hypothetical protein GMKNLPBB_02053 [Myxococcota bacterium]|nr:hypothetical protein [Myxococcota bacterium]